MWSDEVEENPPFHDFCKVYVHYCSRYAGDDQDGDYDDDIEDDEYDDLKMMIMSKQFSDLWSGQKDSGAETGGFHFHGQAIVEVLIIPVIIRMMRMSKRMMMVMRRRVILIKLGFSIHI